MIKSERKAAVEMQKALHSSDPSDFPYRRLLVSLMNEQIGLI